MADRVCLHTAAAFGGSFETAVDWGPMPFVTSRNLFRIFSEQLAFLGIHSSPQICFARGCSDMGDLGMVMPVLYGGARGCSGGLHTETFRVENPAAAYLEAAKVLACMTVELLWGSAEKGRMIREEKRNLLSVRRYLNAICSGRMEKLL